MAYLNELKLTYLKLFRTKNQKSLHFLFLAKYHFYSLLPTYWTTYLRCVTLPSQRGLLSTLIL